MQTRQTVWVLEQQQIEKKQVEVKYSLFLVWLGKESEEKLGVRARDRAHVEKNSETAKAPK